MIEFKFDVAEALKTAGMSAYKAQKSGVISQDTWRKIKNKDANTISMKSLNNICAVLNMQPEHIIQYVETEKEREVLGKFKE